MATQYMLTTINNPFNPFTQWDEWQSFDRDNKTDCCGLLSRTVDSLHGIKPFYDDEEEERIIDEAMNKIVDTMPTIYCKVTEGDKRYSIPLSEFLKLQVALE